MDCPHFRPCADEEGRAPIQKTQAVGRSLHTPGMSTGVLKYIKRDANPARGTLPRPTTTNPRGVPSTREALATPAHLTLFLQEARRSEVSSDVDGRVTIWPRAGPVGAPCRVFTWVITASAPVGRARGGSSPSSSTTDESAVRLAPGATARGPSSPPLSSPLLFSASWSRLPSDSDLGVPSTLRSMPSPSQQVVARYTVRARGIGVRGRPSHSPPAHRPAGTSAPGSRAQRVADKVCDPGIRSCRQDVAWMQACSPCILRKGHGHSEFWCGGKRGVSPLDRDRGMGCGSGAPTPTHSWAPCSPPPPPAAQPQPR